MWQVLEPNIETVRRRLAADRMRCRRARHYAQCERGLQIAQLGIDLRPGDEVVTTNQDYGRMLDTWEQRVRRDRIRLTKISFPVPPPSLDDLADRLIAALTPATGPAFLPHHEPDRSDLPGPAHLRRSEAARHQDGCRWRTRVRTLPVQGPGSGMRFLRHEPAQMAARANRHGVPLRQAGEHSGALALTPAPEKRQDDIRKFEEIGTHPAANHNAIAEALTFHEGIGSERKAARLRYLRDRWAGRLAHQDKVRIHTNLKPEQSCAIGTVQIVGVPTPKVIEQLWARWRIIATPIVHAEYEGARVTPNIYTTLEEIDTFAAGMEEIARKGVAG